MRRWQSKGLHSYNRWIMYPTVVPYIQTHTCTDTVCDRCDIELEAQTPPGRYVWKWEISTIWVKRQRILMLVFPEIKKSNTKQSVFKWIHISDLIIVLQTTFLFFSLSKTPKLKCTSGASLLLRLPACECVCVWGNAVNPLIKTHGYAISVCKRQLIKTGPLLGCTV